MARGGLGGFLVAELRFCAYQYQHLPLDALQQRWRDAERLGFDVVWNCDTVVEPDRDRHAMFDGPATLTMMAAGTTAIRVGTLVSSLYFRQPVTLDLCVAAGRDPSTIRHSLVCFPPLTPWQSVEYFRDMVGRFGEIGIDEFVLYWPQNWREAPGEDAVFEEVTTTLIPRLRASR